MEPLTLGFFAGILLLFLGGQVAAFLAGQATRDDRIAQLEADCEGWKAAVEELRAREPEVASGLMVAQARRAADARGSAADRARRLLLGGAAPQGAAGPAPPGGEAGGQEA